MNIDELQGLWRRDWLQSDDATDDTTRVFWAQAENCFIDIRIPLHRPCTTRLNCLAECDAQALLQVIQAEGFAGHTTLVEDRCTWHREINWHGQSDQIDSGKLWFSDSSDTLMEDGIHADYQEKWQRQPCHKFEVVRFNHANMIAVLLLSDSRFILGAGTADAASTAPLKTSLQQGKIPDFAHQLFASQYCIGHWDGNEGVADLSTNPFCENERIVFRDGNEINWVQHLFDGTQRCHTF